MREAHAFDARSFSCLLSCAWNFLKRHCPGGRGWDKSRYRHHSFARALRALVSRAPDRTAMLRRLGVCRGGMVTGQIEPCITHIGHSDRIIANAIVSWDENFYINSLWKGIYSANLVLIWYNQIYRKEGTINLKLTSNSGYEEHCGISNCPAHQNWSSRSVPRNWEIPRLWQSIGICNSWFKQLYISRHSLDLTINLEKA